MFHIMRPMGKNKRRRCFASSPGGGTRRGAKFAVYDCIDVIANNTF